QDVKQWNEDLSQTIGASRSLVQRPWRELSTKLLTENNILLSYRTVSPMKMELVLDRPKPVSRRLLVATTGSADGLRYLTEVSPLAESLAEAWKEDLHLRAFALKETDPEEYPGDEAIRAQGLSVIEKV